MSVLLESIKEKDCNVALIPKEYSNELRSTICMMLYKHPKARPSVDEILSGDLLSDLGVIQSLASVSLVDGADKGSSFYT